MADIKDLKYTNDYLEQLKNALKELNSQNNFNLTISVNGKPIDEFFRKLEGLNPGELIKSLKDGLGNIDFKTTGVNASAESNEPATESINGIEKFNESVNNLIIALQNKVSVATVSQSQNSELTRDSGSLDDSDIDLSSDFANDFNDDFDDLDELLDDFNEAAGELTDAANSLAKTVGAKAKQQVTKPTEVSKPDDMFNDDFAIDLGDLEERIEDSTKDAVTGVNDLEQPVTPVVEVPDVSEQPETKFSDEVFNELKSSLDALAKNLANVEDVYVSKADEKLSITDKGFKTEHGYGTGLSVAGDNSIFYAEDYDFDDETNKTRKPEDAINAAIDQEANSYLTIDEVVSNMKAVTESLPVFNKALKLAGIELTDIASLNTPEALAKVGVRTASVVDGKPVDRDIASISDEEKQAAIYSKAAKELVEAVKADATARSERPDSKWEENLSNNREATAMLSAVENFATFNDMREDAPIKVDTSEVNRINSEISKLNSLIGLAPMNAEDVRNDPSLTSDQKHNALQKIASSVEEAKARISELNKEYLLADDSVKADQERYSKEYSKFLAKVFQEQKSRELNNAVARGTDPNGDAKTKIGALEEVKSILKDVDKALQKTGAQETSEFQTSKASAQEFLASYDLDSISKRVNADKTEIETFLKNSDRFSPTSDGKEPEKYTSEADKLVSRLLEKSAKDLEIFDNALRNAGQSPLSNKKYQDLKNARGKLDVEANDTETGKSQQAARKRSQQAARKRFQRSLEEFNFDDFSLEQQAPKVNAGQAGMSDSDWLNQQTRRIQSEYRKSSIRGTYDSLQDLINDIESQVSEREDSDRPLDVKKSELSSYNKAITDAVKYIKAAKKANNAEMSAADLAKQRESLTQLERDVNDYKIPSLDGKTKEEQISVFEKAAAATKKFSDELLDYTDSSFKTQVNRIRKTLNERLKKYKTEITNRGVKESRVDSYIKASEENDKEIAKRSSLSAITNEVRQSRIGYNAIRETESPENLYKYITNAIDNVESKIKDAIDKGNSEEEAKVSADVFKRDFLGYQSSQAVAAIRQYVTLDSSSIDKLADSLGSQDKVNALPSTVPDYIKNIVAKSDKKSDVGRAIIDKQKVIKDEQLKKDIANKQAEVDTAKAQVQTAKGDNDTESSAKALDDLANKQKELADLLKAQGDTVKANKVSLESDASANEALDIKQGVPLELQQLNKELNAKLKEIDETIANAKDKLSAQRKAILDYDKTIAASSGKYLPNENAKDSYDRAKATADKRLSQTQTSVYKQALDAAKSDVIHKKAVYDTVSKSDSGATTKEVQVANQDYLDSLKSLASLQEKYKDTDAVKDSDVSNTNASITKASYDAERLKTGVTREATEQLKLFEQQLKQIQSDKTLSTADKAYYTQKVYQKAQDAYKDEEARKDQMDVTPEGQAMPHTNESTVNAYKEFAEQAQKATTYLHQQSVEEERLAANTVQVKQQEQLISQSSNLKDKAQRTKELADIYRRQAAYAKDLTEKETLLAKASKADADAVKIEQQAYQEFLNNVKDIGKAVADLGRSVQASINEIVSLVRAGINITNKYINTTVNGTRKVFSSTQRVIQLFGSLSNRVRQTASTFFNFARQTVSGLQRVGASLANLTARFKTVIDKGNANPLRQSWTELNSAISLAQRAFNGVFNNALLDKAIKFDSTISSITMLLGDEATDNAQEFAKALQDAFGVSYSRTISDLQEITSLLQSAGLQEVGISNEQIGKAAMDFYTISQYLAALGMAGGSATEVMSKLQSGLKGMTQSIDDLGLSVREADMNQFLKDAKKSGQIKFNVKFSELSEANKEVVRLAAILDQFRKTKDIGNFKDLLKQPYYQVSLIKSRVEEIGTMIGKIFEGILSKFLPMVITFLDLIQRVLGNIAGHLNIDLSGDKTQKSLSDISKAADTTKDSIDGAKKSAKEFDGTAGFDEIESLNSSTSSDDELNLGNLLSNVGSLSGMLEQLAKDSLKQTNKVKRNFQKMIDSIVGHHVDLTFGFNKALAKKQVKDIWGNIKRWWKAVKGTGLYVAVRIAEDLKAGRIVNDVLRIVEALTRMGAVIAEYLDPIFRDFYDKHLSKYFKRASRSIHSFSLGMKQLADVVELIFDRKTSNSDIEKAIDNLAKKHPHLAKVAQDLYVLRDNFSGFFAIFQDNPIPDDLLKLNNLKKQFPILTQALAILDAIVDLIRVLYKDYVTPLFNEIRSNFSLVDFLKGVETKIRDLTSLIDSMDFQITVKDNFANLLQAAKTTFENIKSVFSGTLTIGASLVKPTDSNGTVTSQANGGTSVASMAVDSYNKQSTELQGFLSSSADKASAYVTKHKDEIAGIIDSILDQIERQLELLITIIGKITKYLVEHPAFLERIAEMVTNILDYVNKNANTILWLLDTIVGFTFDNFNNLLNSLQLIFDYVSNNKESVKEVLDMFTNFSGEALDSVAKIVISLFDYIAQHKEEVQSLMDKILTFLGWLADHPGVLVTVFKLAVIGKIASVLKTLLSPLGSLFSLLYKIYNLGKEKGIFQSIASGAKGLAGKAKGLFSFGKGATTAAEGAETLGIATRSVPLLETTEVATTSASTATSGLAGAEAGLNVVEGGLTAGTALTGAAGIVAGIAGGVKDAVDGVKKFTDESSTLGDKFAAGITSAVMSDESGLTGALKNGAKWGAVGAGIGTFIAPGIGTAIGGAIGSVGGAIAGAIDTESAIDKVKEIGSGIKEVGVGIKDQFGNSMKESVQTITSDTATIPNKVGAAVNMSAKIFGGLPVRVFSIGKKLVTSLCQNESIQKAFTSARNFATKLWNAAPKIFGAIGSRIAKAFKPMGNAIGSIFRGIKDKATKAFNFVVNKAGGFISNVFNGASDLVDKAESALGIEPEEKKSTSKKSTSKKQLRNYSTSTPVNDPRSAGVASTKGSASYKGLNASNKDSANTVLANYSMGKITKAAANAKLKKISTNLYIRKLGGTVPTGQMFIANEPGNPEYIGRLGTHTAVANNTMITDAMEAAIYNGLVDAWNQKASSTANSSSKVNINLSGFGLIDKQTLRRLAQMLAPYFEANAKSFRTV